MRTPLALAAALAGVILALAPLPSEAQQGQACGVGRPCAAGFTCSNLAGNAVLGWGQCNRDRPRALGEACGPGALCAAGLWCEAGTQVCRAPGTEGASCNPTRPCAAGLSCEALTQVCRRPGIVGETCNPTRPCGNGLTCQAIGSQGLFKCAQEELNLGSARPCGALYIPAASDLARHAGTAFTWGAGGSGTAGIAAGNLETGVAYGPTGEFGCYATVCAGVATPGFTVAAYAAAGIYNSWGDVAGLAFNLNQSVTASRALTEVIDIGPGFNISQWLSSDWRLIGATAGFSMNLGVSVVPIVSLGGAACCTVVADRGAPLSSLLPGVQNCAVTAQAMVQNIASRRPFTQAPQGQVAAAGPPPTPVTPAPTAAPGVHVGELRVGSNVTGNIAGNVPLFAGRPTVWFSFRCAPGLTFQVDATSSWDNVAFVVENGQQVAFSDDANGTNARLVHTCRSGATHYIGVGAYSAANTGPFTVQVSGSGGLPQPSALPPPQPTPSGPQIVGNVSLGSTVSGTVTPSSPVYAGRPTVFYRFQCQRGQGIMVRVSSSWDNVAFITDGAMNQLAFNDDAGDSNARIEWTCPASAGYLIGVGAFASASTGSFSLRVSPGVPNRQLEMRRQPKPDVEVEMLAGLVCRVPGTTSRFTAAAAACSNGLCLTGAPRDMSVPRRRLVGAIPGAD